MSDTSAPAAGFVATAEGTIAHKAGGSGELSLMEAARSITDARRKLEAGAAPLQQAESAEPEPAATAEPELPEKASSDPETDPAEQSQEAEPELPAIEPPNSWTKAEKERFATLPRETQEYLHTRELERERAFSRSQKELADQRKAIAAEREAAEKARQQYEARIPDLMSSLEAAHQASFADIKTMDDVVKLQAEDPFRFQAWQVHQMKLQAAKQEADRVARENETAQQSKWAEHVQAENNKAAELIPELADKEKGPALVKRVATELLPELGFSDSELSALATGKEKLSLYDHRMQKLLADSIKLRDILNAPKAVAAKPLPTVVRPGAAPERSSGIQSQIQALQKELSTASGNRAIEIGAKLTNLRRSAR